MTDTPMHVDEVRIDAALVRRMVAEQFPSWSALPVAPVRSAGTVNAIYRLGPDLAVRLPRVPDGVADLERECAWLPILDAALPLATPVPLELGEPVAGYPFPWAICRWVEGEHLPVEGLPKPRQAAIALARFVAALREVDTDGAPAGTRGAFLADSDDAVRRAIVASKGLIDTAAVTRAWDAALQAPAHTGRSVWTHADLLPGNLLAVDGQLSAVLDFGCMGIADPAWDVIVAWTYLDAATRAVFRAELEVDDATWARARGWVLRIGMIALPYYQETNREFAATARRMVEEVLDDPSGVASAAR